MLKHVVLYCKKIKLKLKTSLKVGCSAVLREC